MSNKIFKKFHNYKLSGYWHLITGDELAYDWGSFGSGQTDYLTEADNPLKWFMLFNIFEECG